MNYRSKITRYSFILTSIFSLNTLYCQTQLDVALKYACLYSTNEHLEELYVFNPDSTVESLKNDILKAAKIQETG